MRYAESFSNGLVQPPPSVFLIIGGNGVSLQCVTIRHEIFPPKKVLNFLGAL